MTPLGQPLGTLVGHTGIFHNDNIYLFGGSLQDPPLNYSNDIIEINITTQRWNKTTLNVGPSARNFHSACLRRLNDHEEMIIFGGKSNDLQNDVWMYRFDDSTWTLLEASNNEVISPRYGQSAVVYGDFLYVFGGCCDGKSFSCSNELFSFNFETREWKMIQLDTELHRRFYHACVLDEESGDWYILGGKSATDLVNDLVKIKLSTIDIEKATCQSEVILSGGLDESIQRFGHSLVLEKSENTKKLFSIGGCNNQVDHLSCISLDLNSIGEGWKIITNHSLSNKFNKYSENIGPVFHVNVPFTLSNETLLNYFVCGGTYQHTEDSNEKKSTLSLIPSKNNNQPEFSIVEFENLVNEDIFRLVLSFLSVPDLLKLQMASKKSRICNLTSEDQYWQKYYYEKLNLLYEASKTPHYSYNRATRIWDTTTLYSDIYSKYLKISSNYRKHFMEILSEIMSKADKEHLKTTNRIENYEQCENNVFVTKENLLKHTKGSSLPKDSYKILQLGDNSIGKTCLWIRMTTNYFPQDYVPTVFDNYSANYVYNGKTVNLALWDAAGPEDDDRLRPLSYPETDLFLLSFSCVSDNSMESIALKWIPEIRHYCPNCSIVLVCTKVDLRNDPIQSRELLVKKHTKPSSYEQGELLAKKMGCLTYLETSALRGIGTEDLAECIVKCLSYDGSIRKETKMGQASPFPCYSESSVSRSEMVSNRMEARQEGLEHFEEPTMEHLLKYIEKCKKGGGGGGGSTSTIQNNQFNASHSNGSSSSNSITNTKASVSSPDVFQQRNNNNNDWDTPVIETTATTNSAQPIVAVNSLPNMTSQNHHLLYPSSNSFSNLRLAGNILSTSQQTYAIHGLNLEKSTEVLENVWDDDVLTSEERENITLFKQTKRNFTGNEHLTSAEIQNLILADRFVLDVFLSMNELTKESATTSSLNIGLIFLEDFNTIGEEREGILPLALQVGTAVLFWSSSRHVVSNIRTHTERRKLKLVPISKIEGTKKVSMALINIARVCCRYNGKHYYDESNCNSQHFVSAVLSRLNLDSVISNKYGYFEELKRGQYRLKYFYSKSIKAIIKETANEFQNNPKWIEEVATSLQVPREEVQFIVNNECIEFKSRAQLDIFGITISHLSIIGGFAKEYSLERSTEIENFWVSETGREDYDFLHIYDMVFDAKSIKEPENSKYKPLSKTSFFFFDDDAMTVTGGVGKEIGELQKGYRITIPHRTKLVQE